VRKITVGSRGMKQKRLRSKTQGEKGARRKEEWGGNEGSSGDHWDSPEKTIRGEIHFVGPFLLQKVLIEKEIKDL